MNTHNLGQKGEKLALGFLKKRGYKILQTNFHSRFGEIDIIAVDNSNSHDPVLAFIEVKTREDNQFGTPQEAITPWKIDRMIKTAQFFQTTKQNLPESQRLDGVFIEMKNGEVETIELIKNLQ